jgi:transposase
MASSNGLLQPASSSSTPSAWWSGDGLCLLMKRLEKGRFVWPQATSGTVVLSPAQLSMLLEGIDWRQPTRTAQPTSAL